MTDTEYICLDTEFVNNVSIIELSVFSISGREIYHRLFRPSRQLKWTAPPDKLKITPEMVADKPTFGSMLPEVQPIFDKARFIIGYAIDNDIKMLEKEGVAGLLNIRPIEVRELYWLVKGREDGVDLYAVPNLLSCCNELGITFDEAHAHFASSDTLATLRCFHELMRRLCQTHGVNYNDRQPDEAMALFDREFEIAKKEYMREQAHGFLSVVRTERGFKIKSSRFRPETPVEVCVEVADRSLAEYDVMKRFAKREIQGLRGWYRLNASDIDFVRSYKNVYREGSAEMLRKLMQFKGRLSF